MPAGWLRAYVADCSEAQPAVGHGQACCRQRPACSPQAGACSVLLYMAGSLDQAPEADQEAFRAALGALDPEQLCALVRRVQQHITIEAYEEPSESDAVRLPLAAWPACLLGRPA